MDPWPTILVFAAAAAVYWLVRAGGPGGRLTFRVRLTDGRAAVDRGPVPPEFLAAADEAAADYRVRAGWVGGVRARGRVRLVFGPGLPPGFRQRLRNAWGLDH